MYYSYPCSYCGKLFYTFNNDKHQAAQTLYYGVKDHLINYGEDEKEHELDDGPETDTQEIYAQMIELKDPPAGGTELK